MSNKRKLRGSDWEPFSRMLRGHEDHFRAEADALVPGFNDQFDAAAAEAGRFNDFFRDRAKESHQDEYLESDVNQLPEPLPDQVRGLYMRVMTELAAGERKGCRHVSLKTPVPSIAPVFADWIRCLHCYMSQPTNVRLTEREEHTCDLCGGYQPGQTMDSFFPQLGPVMLIIGVCPACRAKAGPSKPSGS
jgi:hypothetical protein